jgi:sulfatase maturation enzyme AslB (radical SAM superfamily)
LAVQIHMATVNTCNASCHFCVYSHQSNTLPKGVMSMDLYKKIIDEAKTIPVIDSIAFSASRLRSSMRCGMPGWIP